MGIYETNLKALESHNGFFLGDFRRLAATAPAVVVQRQGANLLATLSGATHTLTRVANVDHTDSKIGMYVLNGFGDGSFVTKLVALPQVEHVLVYEPHVTFLKSLWEAEDFSGLLASPKLRLICSGDESGVQAAVSRYFYEDSFRLTHVFKYVHMTAPGAQALPGNESSFAAFQKIFVKEIDVKLSRVRPNEEDAFWGLLNTLDNFPELFSSPSIESLSGIFAGKPGVVVAAGPSLGKSIELLKKYQNEVVIFCCDASLKKLLSSGIVPDFVATVERLGASGNYLKGVTERIPLLAPSTTPVATLKSYPGSKIFLHRDNGFDDWMAVSGEVVAIGNITSVAHLCYVGLRKMGCDPVCLIGQDLSYDPQTGKSHEDGVMFSHKDGEVAAQSRETSTVVGYDGKPRRTHFYWKHFGQLYGVLIKKYGGRVLNLMPIEHGVPIDMTERLDPEAGFRAVAKGVIDKSVLKSLQTAPKVNTSATESGKVELEKWRQRLRHYSTESLAAMRGISEMWRDLKPAHDLPDFEPEWEKFFASLEDRLAALRQYDQKSFDKGFLKLIINSFLGVRIERASLLSRSLNSVDRISLMIQIYFKSFNLIHLWSARSLEALEVHNRERWHFW